MITVFQTVGQHTRTLLYTETKNKKQQCNTALHSIQEDEEEKSFSNL